MYRLFDGLGLEWFDTEYYPHQAELMPGNTARIIAPQMTGATTYVHLKYGIHAMVAVRRRASARVDSRVPVADGVLIAGHAGTAAATARRTSGRRRKHRLPDRHLAQRRLARTTRVRHSVRTTSAHKVLPR